MEKCSLWFYSFGFDSAHKCASIERCCCCCCIVFHITGWLSLSLSNTNCACVRCALCVVRLCHISALDLITLYIFNAFELRWLNSVRSPAVRLKCVNKFLIHRLQRSLSLTHQQMDAFSCSLCAHCSRHVVHYVTFQTCTQTLLLAFIYLFCLPPLNASECYRVRFYVLLFFSSLLL